MSAEQVRIGGLNHRIAELMPRLSYRRATTRAYRDQIFRLRHDAYLREGAIAAQPDGLFHDEVDDADNTLLYGLHVDGELVSSLRLTVTLHGNTDLPTAHVFPDILQPELDAGRVIVDPTRFVVDHAASRRFPELAYLTTRLAWVAAEHFEADLLLIAVRSEHVPFYKRLWSAKLVEQARPYPHLSKPICLSWVEHPEVRETVEARHSFLRSSSSERERIFGSPSRGGMVPGATVDTTRTFRYDAHVS